MHASKGRLAGYTEATQAWRAQWRDVAAEIAAFRFARRTRS